MTQHKKTRLASGRMGVTGTYMVICNDRKKDDKNQEGN